MHSHETIGLSNINIPEGAKKIVLVGNPNVGKSVFFNSLTGMYVDVSNFPGTTVDISHGRFGQDVVIDTPGIYGISSFNDEERVARDVILAADMIVNVVDAVHLERDLFLTLQVIDTGIPVIVALNMMDEAEKEGISIDVDLLEDLLGVPVLTTAQGVSAEAFQGYYDNTALFTKFVDALGIKRAMTYQGINVTETFEPVGIVIKRISDCIDERLTQMKQRQAAVA